MKVQEAYKTQKRQDKNFHLPYNNQNTKEILLRAAKEKDQVTYEGRPLRIYLTSQWKPYKPASPGQTCCRH